MSLKGPNEKKKPTSNLLGRRFGDFKEGEVVFGIIKRIEKFGMFVTVEQSSVVSFVPSIVILTCLDYLQIFMFAKARVSRSSLFFLL
jgi:hypothetical protein